MGVFSFIRKNLAEGKKLYDLADTFEKTFDNLQTASLEPELYLRAGKMMAALKSCILAVTEVHDFPIEERSIANDLITAVHREDLAMIQKTDKRICEDIRSLPNSSKYELKRLKASYVAFLIAPTTLESPSK